MKSIAMTLVALAVAATLNAAAAESSWSTDFPAAQALAQPRSGGGIPAGQGEVVAVLKQQSCCLKTDTRAAASEQDVPPPGRKRAHRRHARTSKASFGEGLGMTLSVRS